MFIYYALYAFIYVLALICLIFAAACVSSRDITRATLEELSKLLDQYKDSMNGDKPTKYLQPNRSDFSSPFLIPEQKLKCATNCRDAYKECQFLSDNHLQKYGCSETYMQCFPQCFFGKSIADDNKQENCEKYCQFNFDQCILVGSKVEQFACFSSRKACKAKCSNELVVSKRGCPEDCAGEHQLCMMLVQDFAEHHMCNTEEARCKARC